MRSLREAINLELVVEALNPHFCRTLLPKLLASDLEMYLVRLNLEEVVPEPLHYLMELYLVVTAKYLQELSVGVYYLADAL